MAPGDKEGPAALRSTLRHRPFALFLAAQILSQIGTQGTMVALLYHMYQLTGSTLQVGLVGLARGLSVLVFAPVGGHYADRLDRRRLLQVSQTAALALSLALAVLTLTGAAEPAHLLVAVVLKGAAQVFDGPARRALIPAIVPPGQLVKGFAILNPSGQVGKLAGPALAGLLIAVTGPGLMYLVDAVTFTGLIVVLTILRLPPLPAAGHDATMLQSIVEGATYIRRRPLILQLIALDVAATMFTAYKVVLPALAEDVLAVGATGYGALAAAPAVGSLCGGIAAYRLAGTSVASGRLVLGATGGMGAAAIALGVSRSFAGALLAVAMIGLFDSLATVIRQAAVLLETPDRLRGRVSSLYSIAATGGPSLGDLNIGWLTSAFGLTVALSVGGAVPLVCAAVVGLTAATVRNYRAGERPDSVEISPRPEPAPRSEPWRS